MLLRKALAFYDSILDFLAYLCAAILIFFTVAVCLDVTLRFLFNEPIMWVTEMSEYGLLYVTFLGSAWLLRREGHVVSDLLINNVGPRAQAICGIIGSIVGIVIALAMIWYGTSVTWDAFERGLYRPTVLETPKGPLLMVIPFGGFLLLVQFVRRMLGFVAKWRVPDEKTENLPEMEPSF